jgi:5-methylcytosine-specific restriction endonuclease McrA
LGGDNLSMTKNEYQKYLKSSHWRDVKRRFRRSKLYRDTCYICGKKGCLHLHHKSYKRLGSERLTDLVQLCSTCHREVHDILKERASMKTNLWNIARKLRKRNYKFRKRNYKFRKRNYELEKTLKAVEQSREYFIQTKSEIRFRF